MVIKPDAGDLHPLAWSGPTLATFTRWHGQARRWQTFTLEIISRQIAESPLFTDLPAVIIQDKALLS